MSEITNKIEKVESLLDELGWEYYRLQAEELRMNVQGVHDSQTHFECPGSQCEYVGPMNQPMQTMDMPMVVECPACGETDDHPTHDG